MDIQADLNTRTLDLTRDIDAPRELVFKAWIKPELLVQWWGPAGFTIVHSELDVREGGSFRIIQRSPDGIDYTKRGVYREIAAPERIAFTFAWEDAQGLPGHQTLVTVTFTAVGHATRLTLHQTLFDTAEACESHRWGWTSCLQRFADWLEGTAL